MEREEILDILEKTHALTKGSFEDTDGAPTESHIECIRLLEDPIVTNRFAVEALQKLPHGTKFDVVVTPFERGLLFGYSVATAAWARFVYTDEAALNHGFEIGKNDKVLIVDDVFDDPSVLCDLIDLVESKDAKVIGALSLFAVGDLSDIEADLYPLVELESACCAER